MELQEVGRYSVEPFALERILELELVKKINEHTRFYARGVLKEGVEDSLIHEQWEEKPIKLLEDGNPVFCGLAQDVGVICENGVYYLEVEAVSWTVKLDKEEKRRSFQESGRSYSSIAGQLAGEAGGSVKCTAPEKMVQNLLLEYRETDWEFLKRLASHSGSVLVPDSKAEKPSFSFGLPAGSSHGEVTGGILDFAVHKKAARYRRLSLYEWVSQEQQAEEYTVCTAHAVAEIGDTVTIKGKTLYVRGADIKLKGSVLLCTLHATEKAGVSVQRFCHPYISGLTLRGTVVKAVKDRVCVKLDIDLGQSGSYYPFPYATGFSNEGHTGWYVMPEEGDKVQIIFPTEEEYTAYAVQSVRQEDTDRTEDPRVKYLRSADGKEIKLDRKEILITANDGVTLIRMNEDSGIDIFTDKEVNVISDGDITVQSDKNISMTSKKNFSIHAGKDLDITADGKINVSNDWNTMEMVPRKGTQLTSEDKINIAGEDNVDMTSNESINIASKARMTLKSKDVMRAAASKDLTLFSGRKMSLTAARALEEHCSGSSFNMDGTISMKAKLIQEN